MKRFGAIFEILFKKNFGGEVEASSKCNLCLRRVRLYLLLFLSVFISERFPVSSAASVNYQVIEGQKTTLNCTNATTLSGPVNYTWYHQDGLIPQSRQQNTSQLVFPVANKSLSGVYVCSYSLNGSAWKNETIQLTVQYPPRVARVSPSRSVSYKPGERFMLSCITDAEPPVNKVKWTKDKVHYDSINITISSANCNDSGLYECFPSNAIGSSTNNGSIHVTIQDKPHHIILIENKTTATTLTLTWRQSTETCLPLNHTIVWWLVHKLHIKYKKTIHGSNYTVTIGNLMPYSGYGVYIQANNGLGSGAKFLLEKFHTEIGAPSTPLSVQAIYSVKKCGEVPSVYVNWTKPLHINGPVNDLCYKIYYTVFNSSNPWRNTTLLQYTNYSLTGLNSSTTYLMKVQACNPLCSHDSNVINVTVLVPNCSSAKSPGSDEQGLGEGFIALIIILVFFIIVCLILLACLKYRGGTHTLCGTMPFKGLFSPEQSSNTSISKVTSFKEKREKEAVPYERFWNHVILRHADTNYRFSSEFEALSGIVEKNKKLTWIHSQRPENQPKNRFANVVAYDQTRVVLSMIDNVHGSHYINANYVDSYNAMNFYIATQGPLANTIADFWRMVWEQNSRVIVMITNIIEKGRHKCAQYWPTKNRKVQDHGQLRVTFLKEENFAFYTQREFELKPLKDNVHYTQLKKPSTVGLTNGKPMDSSDEAIKPIIVQQFHFTGWPDHGVPEPGYEIAVLDFIFKSTAAQVDGAGPLVVHCSAGVGRSGTFIVIDSMAKRIHDNGDIDIFNFLCHIRQQRNHLVQEECQYIFIHDVILEYIQCGFLLSLPKKALKDHLHKLRVTQHAHGKTKLAAEFEKLKSITIPEYSQKEGSRNCNINKNRNTTLIPVDTCRVKLYPRPGEEGSDYINASYLDGFWRREAYVATQYPLESTIFDFWRMVWQENCRSIVMLISMTELEQSAVYPRYLPVVHDTARFGVYEVTMESESARGDLMIRDLIMTSLNEPGETRRIRHFHFLHWPDDSHPWSGQSLLQLVSKVDEWEKHVKAKSKPFDMIGPIVVHCSNGSGRSGVYCALHTLWHQVVREEVISVYPYTRLYFHQRPQIIQSQAQYEFIYDTMVEYIDADCSLYLV